PARPWRRTTSWARGRARWPGGPPPGGARGGARRRGGGGGARGGPFGRGTRPPRARPPPRRAGGGGGRRRARRAAPPWGGGGARPAVWVGQRAPGLPPHAVHLVQDAPALERLRDPRVVHGADSTPARPPWPVAPRPARRGFP